MTDLVTAVADRYGTSELRIGASIMQLGHAARLWSPTLACALTHRVVPDLAQVQRADGGAALRLPEATGRNLSDLTEDQVSEVLYRVVVREHLEPLAAGLQVKVAARLLYGNTASALVEAGRAIVAGRPELGAPVVRLVTGLLGTGGLAGLGEITGPDLAFRRRTCCLYYRVPGGMQCTDCSLTEKEPKTG
ncbi:MULTISPECIES: (2Fe-2S)-binding protein [Actinomadura]|uniref:(2Fe-2S)-binding protein n=1 Tax=Actinomadura yumaensis TaxID=111807 RepID=A0ABW2CEY0_9ACTN|nr:(2Fe-2S)-binding protein [Actinomadura sp. J1-007]MWK38430.1 iron reductase [Actinomadura sp. J1-007]